MSPSGLTARGNGPPAPGPDGGGHPGAPISSGRLGMILFLAALGMLFAGAMVAYLVVRLRAPAWPPAGSPRLPEGLWISTLLLLASSATMVRALRRAREGRSDAIRNWLLGTGFLGCAFLVSQLINWLRLLAVEDLHAQSNLYAFTFYVLTGLHGAHVVGGLIPLGIAAVRSGRGRYTAEAHEGLGLLAMYWHFLDVVWLVMFFLLVIVA
jgi:cytochrome c oxidase subunit 3